MESDTSGYHLPAMDRQNPSPRTDVPTASGLNDSRIWLLVLLVLFLWHGWTTLILFAPPFQSVAESEKEPASFHQIETTTALAWQRMLNDQPIMDGRHPLHLYFGYLGAQAWHDHGTLCCYDPSFYAGYPKTPVFDSGSRPAELFLILGGSDYRPAAYKIGLAICCGLTPLLLALAAWGLGLGRGFGCLAVALGLLVWQSTPCRMALEEGNLDLLMGALAGLTYVCLLVRFHQTPGLRSWISLLITACVGWFTHPFLILLLLPLLLIYYFSVGAKHQMGWHLALLASLAGGVVANGIWLIDWVRYWWIRLPLQMEFEPLRHRTFHSLWSASLWGDGIDRTLAAALIGLAAAGVFLLNQNRQRPAARLLGLGAGGFLIMTVVGAAWPSLGRLGTQHLWLPALWFAVMPAVAALAYVGRGLVHWTGSPGRAVLVCVAILLAGAFVGQHHVVAGAQRYATSRPFTLGLGPEQIALIDVLQKNTTPEARILWEDRSGKGIASRWSALLPLWTGRAFISGLDPDACIEHASVGLKEQTLAGRSLVEWSDAELEEFCRRYNVGWVVCWSPAAQARFRNWTKAAAVVAVADQGPGFLFRVPPQSFVLKGQARLLSADRRHIALADVVPEDGKVVLSLHYQTGLQVSPGRVQIERELDPSASDPIPFIRLRMTEAAARVTLTWEGR